MASAAKFAIAVVPLLYRAPSGFVDLDSLRNAQIDLLRSPCTECNDLAHSDRFCNAKLIPNSQNLPARGIDAVVVCICVPFFEYGGNCKTRAPGKINDFEPVCQFCNYLHGLWYWKGYMANEMAIVINLLFKTRHLSLYVIAGFLVQDAPFLYATLYVIAGFLVQDARFLYVIAGFLPAGVRPACGTAL